MSTCKTCGCEINMIIFGMPDDECYGCLTDPEKMALAEKNVDILEEDDEKEEQK